MLIQTRSQTQQHKQTLPSTSKNMVEEAHDRHATDKKEQLIGKSLARQQTKMFTQFSEILMRVTSKSGNPQRDLTSIKSAPSKCK